MINFSISKPGLPDPYPLWWLTISHKITIIMYNESGQMPTLSLVEPSPSTQSQKRGLSDLQEFRDSSTFDRWRVMGEDRNASLTALRADLLKGYSRSAWCATHEIRPTWSANNNVRVALSGRTNYSGYIDVISFVLHATRLGLGKR